MVLPPTLSKAKIGDVIKCIPAGGINLNRFFYAILTHMDIHKYEIDNGDERKSFFINRWNNYFDDIHFVRSNQLLLKTSNSEEVMLFLVDEKDNIVNYKKKILVRNPYFKV